MKKSIVIVIGIFVVLALVAIILLSGSPGQQPVGNDTDSPNRSSPTEPGEENPVDGTPEEPGTTDPEQPTEPEEPVEEVIPEPTAADVQDSILSADDETDKKFLTAKQKKELDSPSMSKTNPQPREEKSFTVTWGDTDFAAVIPALPSEATLYLLDRPKNESTYDFLRQLATNLDIKGAVIRMSEQNYTIANITTGEFFVNYDLYHLLYEANNLSVPVSGAGAEGVQNTLGSVGLLGFPHTVKEEEDSAGNTWYRFVPDLPLDVLSMETATGDDSEFEPGRPGVVDVAVKGSTITEIIAGFPNVEEKGNVTLADTTDIANLLKKGSFQLGDAQLQYPGALKVEDKRAFFDLINQSQVEITDAEVSDIECGYFLEDDDTVQAILAPSCIVSGKGKVRNYSVLFEVVSPIVK